MRVSVVIPTYNNRALTSRCLEVLFALTPPAVLAEVVVVDDGSTDAQSVAWTAAQTAITPVLLAANRGFSSACNAGAARCSGDAILFLNNDAFVHDTTLATLAAVLDADATIGIVGARLLYADGTLQHAGLALLPGAVSRWWHVHRGRDGDFPDATVARDFLAVTGAALMVRRSLFVELGGFDEDLINGWEDVDLCLRAWRAGARVRYEPRAVLEHLESATLGHTRDNNANETRFADRWDALLADAPRYPLAEVPPIALAVKRSAREGCDNTWALAHVDRHWNAGLGAAVSRVRPASRLDRAWLELRAALARRRPTLEVAWDDACLLPATGNARVAFVAPRSAADARRYAEARDVTAWWTPTDTARDALLAAGAANDRVRIARLGAQMAAPPDRFGPPVVGATTPNARLLDAVRRAVPQARTVVLSDAGPPDLRELAVVVAAGGEDRWGLLVSAALAHGCHVIAGKPIDSLHARALGVTVVDDAQLLATTIAQLREIATLRAAAQTIYFWARRTLHVALATQHIAELARAITGGIPSSALVAVDANDALRSRPTVVA